MKRFALAAVFALLLVVTTALAIGGTTSAVAQDGLAPVEADPTPMLEALSLLPLGIDAFEFTDWAALKAAHGGADVSSASPLAERQQLMLDLARSEATTFPLGLDRLDTWSERWGWDTTDLEWQASCCNAFDFFILRFREDWDAGPFMARLEADGYERRDLPHATSFTLEPGTDAPDRDYLERVLGIEGPMGDAPSRASVAIAPDGRTVVLVWGPDAHEILKLASRADPVAIADGPFGRVAAALGRSLAASVVGERYVCTGTGVERDLRDEDAPLVEAIGVLHPYQAFGLGYERDGPGEPAVGRYIFAYEHAKDASADLPGRRTLIEEGESIRYGAPYRDSVFTSSMRLQRASCSPSTWRRSATDHRCSSTRSSAETCSSPSAAEADYLTGGPVNLVVPDSGSKISAWRGGRPPSPTPPPPAIRTRPSSSSVAVNPARTSLSRPTFV